MSKQRLAQLRTLEGRQVSIALTGGSRIDTCELVAGARPGTRSLWVFTNGSDLFVPVADVIDVWES